MKRFYILIILGVLLTFRGYSQDNPRVDKKTLFSSPVGVKSARKNFKIAEKFYKKGKGTFDEALKYYLKVYEYNQSSIVLNYKIGICYVWATNKKASLKYLLESSPEASKLYYLALGRAYQYNLMFDEAKNAYDKYFNGLKQWQLHDIRKLHNQLISECEVGKEILQDSLPVFIINLGPIVNSYYDDYGATLSYNDSTMYFTSKRPVNEPSKRVSRFKFNEQIFQTNNNAIDGSAEWVDGIPKLSSKVNTSIAWFDRYENRIYYYKGKVHNGRLFTAIYEDGKWRKKKMVKGGINHIAYKETSITFDDDGTAYYITDRRGGLGGKDIWVATKKREHVYNKPVNMGDIINTSFDEEGVYVTPDGNTLFFSSKGRKGMGGFDVYKSVKSEDGTWSEPVNMGYPINTTADEIFYRPTKDSMISLLSTIRSDSYGGLDIYKVQVDPSIPFKLTGTVTDIESGKTLPASVNVYDNNTKELFYSTSIDPLSGMYKVNFDDVGDYFIQIDYEGYKSVTETVNLPPKRYATVVQDFSTKALLHPFTLVGRVTDVDKGTPLQASLTFRFAANTDSIIGRAVSVDSIGKYTITFEDKFDMVIQVDAKDYFSVDIPVSTVNEIDNVITKDIKLKRSKIDYTLTGRILDKEGVNPVYATLLFYHSGENEPFTIVTPDSISGKYSITLDEQGPFMIEVEANGYFYYSEIYSFPEGEIFISKDFKLKKIETGIKFVVDNILFNTGKVTLKPGSFESLNKLAIFLIKNDGIRIEISGHTDNVGSASINRRISKGRALTVRNYIISRGVEADRIEYEGYGFDQPIESNDTKEGRAANRRVEVKIL